MVYLRAKFWRVPVRNACVKKKPEIQNIGGTPPSIHLSKKLRRCIKSSTHEPNGLRDGYATLDHSVGTWPSVMERPISSSSRLITTSPIIAFCTSRRVLFTRLVRRLKRSSSRQHCVHRLVVRDWVVDLYLFDVVCWWQALLNAPRQR